MHQRREFICDLLLGLGGNLIVLGMVLIILFFANVLPIQSSYGGLLILLFAAISVLGGVAVCLGLVLDRKTGIPSETSPVTSPQVEGKIEEGESSVSSVQRLPQLNAGEPQT